jgi:RsbT co-antagonist protein rsbRD N-terminal domain
VETTEFLIHEREAIVEAAEAALARMHARHYESAGASEVRQRLGALYDHLLDALRSRDLGPIVAYAEQVARERFNAGYDLSEVQTAFNALEEATWSRVFAELQPTQFAEALGLVSTILGAAKDALARNYVSLATNTHAPSLDLQALFAGTEGRMRI